VDHGERRAQFVRDVGDEVAAHLFEAHQLGDVARDQQPKFVRVGNQTHVEAQLGRHGRGDVEQRLGLAPGRQPVRHRQRLQAFAERGVDVLRIAQAEQRRRCFVEPEDALVVARDHDDRVGQRRGRRAVGAQHAEQAALARAHVALAAVEQAVEFPPQPATGGQHALARAEAHDQALQAHHLPAEQCDRGDGECRPRLPQQRAEHERAGQQQAQLEQGGGTGGAHGHAGQSRASDGAGEAAARRGDRAARRDGHGVPLRIGRSGCG